jgi:hypothetical protein
MTTAERRVLELAILGLEGERRKLEQELTDLRQRLGKQPVSIAHRKGPNKGRRMTAAQKRKLSLAMKARWAKLKGGKAA